VGIIKASPKSWSVLGVEKREILNITLCYLMIIQSDEEGEPSHARTQLWSEQAEHGPLFLCVPLGVSRNYGVKLSREWEVQQATTFV
jgi:hypothetical protein